LRVAVDTNILVYSEGLDGPEQQRRSLEIIDRLPGSEILLPLQVLGELFRVLTRKARRTPVEAAHEVRIWHASYSTWPTSEEAFAVALQLAVAHHLQIWDALIIAVAAEAGCRILLSEDLQHGAVFAGVTIIDPFAEPHHPMLAAALSS
jgi:predicted nucleic acid-binding protein